MALAGGEPEDASKDQGRDGSLPQGVEQGVGEGLKVLYSPGVTASFTEVSGVLTLPAASPALQGGSGFFWVVNVAP